MIGQEWQSVDDPAKHPWQNASVDGFLSPTCVGQALLCSFPTEDLVLVWVRMDLGRP